MMEWIKNPWPWYVGGPLIGLTVPLLLIFGNKRLGVSSSLRHICAAPIQLYKLKFTKGQVYGGLLFGFGWAITGACPGPLFALIGSGTTVIIVTLLSAIAGTWVYGYLREKLPH
jgi:uncharacterized membrane protein YedE/YeeE